MTTRRQEKVARVIKEAVSDAVANHLNDPRIEGFVSVMSVDVSPDLRNADVYISIFGKEEAAQKKTFAAIDHAKRRIQSLLAHKLRSKFCPVLRFHRDEKTKNTLETMKLIDRTSNELKNEDSVDQNKN